MADYSSPRHHTKRNGLTDSIKKNLLKTTGSQEDQKIMNQLIARMNSSPSREATHYKSNYTRPQNTSQKRSPPNLPSAPQENTHFGISVGRTDQKTDRSPAKELKRVLSVDRLSYNINATAGSRKSKKQRAGLLGKMPLLVSKRSTEYSWQSEEALVAQNQRIRQLCASEQERLLKMEKLIANEEKAQLLKRHMYEQNIDRLKKIAALEIFRSEDSGNMEQTSSYGEDYDCLSIHSH